MRGEGQSGLASDGSVLVLETAQLEPIHLGARHRLYRRRSAAGAIVLKVTAAKLPGASAIASMRHEYELLRDLDLKGVVKVLGLVSTDQGLALTMEDAGSSTVAELSRSGPLPISQFFDIAAQVTEALASLHEARIVHRDVSPANIVWDAVSARATLTDFGVATTLAALTVESFSSHNLETTLAYVAPEQTGRTGRSADSRADLYSLGATFYQMLTGSPPFASEDPIAIIHAHVARQPKAVHELNEKIPRPLCDIDNGVGISPQLLPRVFDLFVQSDRALDRSQGGLGIGLSVVKRLMHMHGGEVSARSDGEGQGTTFEIRLPRIERHESTAREPVPPTMPHQRVLVVDDNADAANSLALLLNLQGQATEVAYDGKQALERLQAFRPEFVLLDLGLPEMDGYEVARRIRAMPEFEGIRLVALSGYGQPEDRRRTQAAGFDGHLVKPVDMTLLTSVLTGDSTITSL